MIGDSRSCEYQNCEAPAIVLFCKRGVCNKHLEMHCRGEIDLRRAFGMVIAAQTVKAA